MSATMPVHFRRVSATPTEGRLSGGDVSDDTFCLTREQLAKYPDSLLLRMLDDVGAQDVVNVPEDDPDCFRLLAGVYRSSAICCASMLTAMPAERLEATLQRYGLPRFGRGPADLPLQGVTSVSHLELVAHIFARSVADQVLEQFPSSLFAGALGLSVYALPFRSKEEELVVFSLQSTDSLNTLRSALSKGEAAEAAMDAVPWTSFCDKAGNSMWHYGLAVGLDAVHMDVSTPLLVQAQEILASKLVGCSSRFINTTKKEKKEPMLMLLITW